IHGAPRRRIQDCQRYSHERPLNLSFALHAVTKARTRRRLISIGTPPLLIACCHSRPPKNSPSITQPGPLIPCESAPLISLVFLGGVVGKFRFNRFCFGAPLSWAGRTRLRAFSLHASEQNRCCLDCR